ncbi:hypothetical protein M9H77_15807 [Catharanthus roseus]|uniref:Uncharacterized protein n=1 Tax=Catharanthus roseus TaxID=4058 RepID=A0ACC0B0D5_CATRO|nr:hypothetical protein M9H77_15807 [Catharanthus roseus]
MPMFSKTSQLCSILIKIFVSLVNKGGHYYFLDNQYTYEQGPDNPPTSLFFGPKFTTSKLYKQCPPQICSVVQNYPESLEGLSLTKENYGSVHRVCIIYTDDQCLNETQRWMIEKNPPDELQVFDGSDHMPMFSRTSELCSCLIEVASKISPHIITLSLGDHGRDETLSLLKFGQWIPFHPVAVKQQNLYVNVKPKNKTKTQAFKTQENNMLIFL